MLAIREDHHPEENHWIAMAGNYNHSTYIDIVLSGLFGIVPIEEGLQIYPHVPAEWARFAVEDVPFRGHRISVFYDRESETGEQYTIRCDGETVFRSTVIEKYLFQC
jgi:hypothetical protein